jgi:Kdo2-lipid IVA lauroyltransferase/acyltransferase
VILQNIQIAFPEMTQKERVHLGRQAMIQFCIGIVEYSSLPFLKENGVDDFQFEGAEHLNKALEKGKGVLLLSLHIGNGDIGSAALALNGWPIHLVSKVFKTQWLNQAWFGMRERVGVKFIPPRNSSYGVLKALKKNEVVIFVMDQFTGPPIGIKTTFFGRETGTGVGLAVMAQRSGAPVIPAYTLRGADGKIKVIIEPEIPFVELENKDETLLKMTQSYNDLIERVVRKNPDQWMWLHKRWKLFKY